MTRWAWLFSCHRLVRTGKELAPLLQGELISCDKLGDMLGLLYGAYMLLSGLSYIYTTRRGKFQVWAEFLSGLKLRGNEQILDLGCGRGALLLMAATLLQEGKATGVDIWKTIDQSGNALSAALKNIVGTHVSGRGEIHEWRQHRFALNVERHGIRRKHARITFIKCSFGKLNIQATG
jgi:SAM-dependent methyltransferase